MTFSRVSGIAALGFVLVVVVANVLLNAAGLPPSDADPAQIAAFFADHSVAIGLANGIAPLAWLLLTVFGAGALARISRIERERGEGWSMIGMLGLVMQNVVFAVGVVGTQLALLGGEAAAGPATGALWDLHNSVFTINGAFLAVALAGFSIGGLRTATMKTWHASVGLVGAVLLLASAVLTPVTVVRNAGGLAIIGLVGFVLWLVWLVTFGLTLVRSPATQPTSAPAKLGARPSTQPA